MEWSQQGSHRHFDELKLQLLDVIKADIEKFSIEKFSRRTALRNGDIQAATKVRKIEKADMAIVVGDGGIHGLTML